MESPYNWKEDAIERYEANEAEQQRRGLETDAPPILEKLAAFGLTGAAIIRQTSKTITNRTWRVVIDVDGVNFGIIEYGHLAILKLCPHCGQLMKTWNISDWQRLGQALSDHLWQSHYCPSEQSPDTALLEALDAFIQSRGYKPEE